MSDHLTHPDPAVRDLIDAAYQNGLHMGWRMAVIAAERDAHAADKAAAEVHS